MSRFQVMNAPYNFYIMWFFISAVSVPTDQINKPNINCYKSWETNAVNKWICLIMTKNLSLKYAVRKVKVILPNSGSLIWVTLSLGILKLSLCPVLLLLLPSKPWLQSKYFQEYINLRNPSPEKWKKTTIKSVKPMQVLSLGNNTILFFFFRKSNCRPIYLGQYIVGPSRPSTH